MTPEELQARILYRDALMLVIDKPAGMAVHKGPKGGTTLEDFFPALQFGLPNAPALAHRLDRETSGCLVLGRHKQALARLGDLFAKNLAQKTYLAVVQGVPAQPSGIIKQPLRKKSQQKNSWWMMLAEEGQAGAQSAETHYEVLKVVDGHALLKLTPKTGRTHQLRLHCVALGCPILGEKIYGDKTDEAKAANTPLHLHASRIELPLYPKKPAIVVEAPAPEIFAAYL